MSVRRRERTCAPSQKVHAAKGRMEKSMAGGLASLAACRLCPRGCDVNRLQGERGFCGGGRYARVALVSLHPWEEPCLAGEKGAGTVFFTGCNMRCAFCQNHEISREDFGIKVTEERLAEIFLEQEARGAATLDLVTPTHFAPQIAMALRLARERGLTIPVVYNSSAYDAVDTIESMTGLVDIFLPDLKYIDEETALRCSAAPGYFRRASAAIRRMREIAGLPAFDEDGRMKRGVLVRHLVLPGHRKESMCILDWLWQNFSDTIYISLMNQYTPMGDLAKVPELARRLTTFEYESVVDHARSLGIENCYIQQGGTVSASFVPHFDGRGVEKIE